MRSTPAQDARLRDRLKQAVAQFSDGNTDAFGRSIGYRNGGYIRQCLQVNDPRPVRESLIDRVHAVPEMAGWFDPVLTPLSVVDIKSGMASKRPAWPFKKITPAEWSRIPPDDAVVAEDSYIRAIVRLQTQSHRASPRVESRKPNVHTK